MRQPAHASPGPSPAQHSAFGFRSACLVLAGLLVLAPRIRAEHFDVTLTVESATEKQEAHADSSPPAEGSNPRPLFHGRVGEPLTFQFFMTDVNPHEELPGVVIRYFVAPETAPRATPIPGRKKDAILQGQFKMDFKLKGKAGLRQRFQIDRAGYFLLRVETEHSHSDHEHFSAIDLQISP